MLGKTQPERRSTVLISTVTKDPNGGKKPKTRKAPFWEEMGALILFTQNLF